VDAEVAPQHDKVDGVAPGRGPGGCGRGDRKYRTGPPAEGGEGWRCARGGSPSEEGTTAALRAPPRPSPCFDASALLWMARRTAEPGRRGAGAASGRREREEQMAWWTSKRHGGSSDGSFVRESL
jgi:hypothetical protein